MIIKNLLVLILLFSSFTVCLAQYNTEEDGAMRLYQSGNYRMAAQSFGRLFEKTQNKTYFNLYFNSLLRSKQFKEAESTTKKLLKRQPRDTHYLLSLARVYKEQGQNENAAKTYDEMLNALPGDEPILRELANQLYQTEEHDLAIQVFEKGRKMLDNNKAFSYELLSLYRHKRDKQMLILEYLNVLAETPGMLTQAQAVLSAVLETSTDYLQLQQALLKRIQKDPDNDVYSRLLIWQYLQQQDYEMVLRQLIAADKKTHGYGQELYDYVQIFLANKSYATAEKAYTYLLSKGKNGPFYLSSRLGILEVRYQLLLTGKSDVAAITRLEADYQIILDEYGKNARTAFALRRLANLNAYYLRNLQKAELALEAILAIPGISKDEVSTVKLELADIYVLNKEPWEAVLMYGQVARDTMNQPSGHEAQFKSARLSFFQGNFSYAKSQADVLKASTSQLIANDALNLSLLLSDHLHTVTDTLAMKLYASAEFMVFCNDHSSALEKLDSIQVRYPVHSLADNILMLKSRICLLQGNFTESAGLLSKLVQNPQTDILTDDALFMLAGLYENQLNDPEKARLLFQQLITDYPGSMFAAEARRHYRKLRGDNIGS